MVNILFLSQAHEISNKLGDALVNWKKRSEPSGNPHPAYGLLTLLCIIISTIILCRMSWMRKKLDRLSVASATARKQQG